MMKRILFVLVAVVALTAACGAAAPTTTNTDPGDLTLVEIGDLVNGYESDDHPTWNVGVVLEETAYGDGSEYWSQWKLVNSDGEIVTLEPARDDDEAEPELQGLVSPGDIIAWSPSGEDRRVTADEIEVIEVGALGNDDAAS